MVGPVHERLIGDLRGLPLQPEVRAFESLHRGGEELQRFRPDVLLVQLGPRPAEDIGALRLLRNLWSDVGVVLVTDLAGEIETTALAQRVGAHRLVYPDRPGELAATIEQARHGADGGRGGAFHDLAHGMADEINNPLQSVSGQLQLLHADLDPTTQRARRDQVRAALEGVQRIQATVDRLRLVTGAANGPRHREPVDLASLLQAHLAARS
ncbi:MAG: HAMP domain-containing histidine kinase, partial [Planctomycetes bacterium]|nr:HAMP domain-containing histidine kinase [Planctomycetota bacterium]